MSSVFEAEADRVDPTAAGGTLGLLLMQPQPLTGGEQLAFEAGELWHVGRSGRRRVVVPEKSHLVEIACISRLRT